MLDSANDSVRRLKADVASAEAAAETARSEASAAARAAEDADLQLAEREAEVADLRYASLYLYQNTFGCKGMVEATADRACPRHALLNEWHFFQCQL